MPSIYLRGSFRAKHPEISDADFEASIKELETSGLMMFNYVSQDWEPTALGEMLAFNEFVRDQVNEIYQRAGF